MNEFQYHLELAKIDTAKYVKDIRELLYSYHSHLENMIYGRLTEPFYEYKLYAKTFTKYHAASKVLLPDKFYKLLKNSQKYILEAVTITEAFDYIALLQLFEYDTQVETPWFSAYKFKRFCNIVGTNKPPFKLIINTTSHALPTSKYFNNLADHAELAILTWMKSVGIPENFTVAAQFRKDWQYKNSLKANQATLAERANLVLALESIDQLTGVEIE